jgi:hypothetical protein
MIFLTEYHKKKRKEPEMNNATCHVVWMFEDLDNYVGSWNNNLKELGWAGSWKKSDTQATLVESWNISFSGSEERRYKFQKSWSLAYFGSKMFVQHLSVGNTSDSLLETHITCCSGIIGKPILLHYIYHPHQPPHWISSIWFL